MTWRFHFAIAAGSNRAPTEINPHSDAKKSGSIRGLFRLRRGNPGRAIGWLYLSKQHA